VVGVHRFEIVISSLYAAIAALLLFARPFGG